MIIINQVGQKVKGINMEDKALQEIFVTPFMCQQKLI